MIELVSLAIGVIGAVPVFALMVDWLLRFRPVRLLLCFQIRTPVDIVVTTSAITESEAGPRILRATTGIGQIQGIAYATRALGRFYRHKEVRLHLSSQVLQELDEDLVLLGGPAKNQITKLFLERLAAQYPGLNLRFDDIKDCVRIGDLIIEQSPNLTPEGYVSRDLSIVVAWINPLTQQKRRGILCCGFTSYGTAGAANWIFNHLVLRHRLWPKRPLSLPAGPFPCFIGVLDVDLARDQVVGVHIRRVIPLPLATSEDAMATRARKVPPQSRSQKTAWAQRV